MRNSAALYGVQVCRKVLPLVTVPYLAHCLGAVGWGTVAFVLSLGELVALLIEFGFNLSSTREIAQNRHSRETCARLMSGVLTVQVLLAMAGIAAAVSVSACIPLLRNSPQLVAAGLLYATAQGFMPLWFFQGLERLTLAAGLEVAAKLLALIGLFVFVHHPNDAWKVVVIQAAAALFSTVCGITLAVRSFSLQRPSLELIRSTFAKGWPMFVFRSAESLYGVGNSFILGLFAAPAVVGYFAVAEKISKAIFGLLNPVREALFPRLSHLVISDRPRAARLARIGVAVMALMGLVLSITLLFGAPALIRLLAGNGFERATKVLGILSALPFVLSITYSTGMQWLLPLGRDRIVNRIILAGGALNIALAFALAPRFAEIGMAYSVLSAELLVCVCMVWTVLRSTELWKGFSWFRKAIIDPAPPGAREC